MPLPDSLSVGVEKALEKRVSIFDYYVNNPERFGVVEFDEKGRVITIEVKLLGRSYAWLVTETIDSLDRSIEFCLSHKKAIRNQNFSSGRACIPKWMDNK